MYHLAAQTFFKNYPIFLIMALTLAIVEATGLKVGLGVSIIAGGFLALFSHRMVLLDECYDWVSSFKGTGAKDLPIWPFLWRYGLFTLAYISALLFVLVPILPESSPGDVGILAFVLVALIIATPVAAVTLALFGTVFPATAVGGDRSFARALTRGRKRFGATVVRLVIGPGLFTVINFAIILVLAMFVNSAVTALMVNFASYFLSFIPLHLTAVALSLAYREAEAA